jgi:hypothetical protein
MASRVEPDLARRVIGIVWTKEVPDVIKATMETFNLGKLKLSLSLRTLPRGNWLFHGGQRVWQSDKHDYFLVIEPISVLMRIPAKDTADQASMVNTINQSLEPLGFVLDPITWFVDRFSKLNIVDV